ncbi:hypothetical protein NPIL_2741 [Nephila pilipes]|uniref:Uncharacterized protein n=1 Tax=Nephila pilipes TaxID=299642 RepID=A0A8X6P0S1_NEPPI|nr:hypothetical protein NPIL_2741 [Nephila pilipes]
MNIGRNLKSKFAVDLVLYISFELANKYQLLPFAIFTPDQSSPFTRAVQRFAKTSLNFTVNVLQLRNTYHSEELLLTSERFETVCSLFVDQCTRDDFSGFTIESCLENCTILAVLGSLRGMNEETGALFISVQFIMNYLDICESKGYIDCHFWRRVQIYCAER